VKWGRRAVRGGAVSVVLALAACAGAGGAQSGGPGSGQSITLYTCVSDSTIQPVIAAFEKSHPGSTVKLFRAPTGQLNARVAGDTRSGGLKADVIWACDPLTMQDYVKQGLVGGWTPQTPIPAQVRTPDYVGVAMLYLVAATRDGVPTPSTWANLAQAPYAGKVAIPDPNVAASALGALGYFSKAPGYGLGYYADLKRAGAVQASTPDDVTNGVASGMYRAGMTIATSAYVAQKKGSPIEVTWPRPGAIGVYGPVAISKSAAAPDQAKAFVSYVTSAEGQGVIGASGSYPTLPAAPGPTRPAGAPVVYPDWQQLGSDKKALLDSYRSIFGG